MGKIKSVLLGISFRMSTELVDNLNDIKDNNVDIWIERT